MVILARWLFLVLCRNAVKPGIAVCLRKWASRVWGSFAAQREQAPPHNRLFPTRFSDFKILAVRSSNEQAQDFRW
ncbi:hypothetical protein A1D17_26470 [Pseudomonas fluorescens]|uniref:Uncharacterized protein n=1 Tax=Pseudomonas fluorescens TaxID=294 RepID=A0A166PZT6_PSEFL|nr:hypothetical protein A1D17_26470 [Pseudomonas fluorescens]